MRFMKARLIDAYAPSVPSPSVSETVKRLASVQSRHSFITPEQVARTAQIRHDTATQYLQEWAKRGILKRPIRYPAYVYARTADWDQRPIARYLNHWEQSRG